MNSQYRRCIDLTDIMNSITARRCFDPTSARSWTLILRVLEKYPYRTVVRELYDYKVRDGYLLYTYTLMVHARGSLTVENLRQLGEIGGYNVQYYPHLVGSILSSMTLSRYPLQVIEDVLEIAWSVSAYQVVNFPRIFLQYGDDRLTFSVMSRLFGSVLSNADDVFVTAHALDWLKVRGSNPNTTARMMYRALPRREYVVVNAILTEGSTTPVRALLTACDIDKVLTVCYEARNDDEIEQCQTVIVGHVMERRREV